jgi:C-terminal processing protease CtpA/Prc
MRAYDFDLLAGPIEKPVALGFVGTDGKSFMKTVPRATRAERLKLPGLPPYEFRMLAGNVAYVAINTFDAPEISKMFRDDFDKISKADALIIDIRENGGGSDGISLGILSCLTDKPFKKGAIYTRNYRPAYRSWGQPEQRTYQLNSVAPDPQYRFLKPVAVLVSNYTYSASEDFLVAYDQMKRGMIVGQPTGGSTGSPLIVNLPGGIRARMCTLHEYYPDGREFVGKGIMPTHPVQPTVQDFRTGRDRVLETALAELKKSTKS